MAYLTTELYKRIVTGLLIVGVTLLAFYGGPPTSIPFLGLLFLIIFFVEWPSIRPLNRIHANLLLFVWVIIPLLTLAWIQIKNPEPYAIFFFLTAWIHDTAAYVTGKLFGKSRILPSISPQKTWEGFIGGFLGLFGVGILTEGVIFKPFIVYNHFFSTQPPLYRLLILSGLISVVLTAGDLFESWLKRKAALKDSSALLPGHGGILDRIDSLLFLILLFNVFILFR